MTRRKGSDTTGSPRSAADDSEGEAVTRRLDALDAEPPARDEARLLAQSPRRLFFYWGFARDPRETLRRALGGAGEGFGLVARLVDLESGAVEASADAARAQSAWFEARARRAYRAEVGFSAEGSPFVRVLSSNVVETAPEAPSEVSDEGIDFHVSPQDFARILASSGFVEPAAEFARRAPSSFALGARASGREVETEPPRARRSGAAENF